MNSNTHIVFLDVLRVLSIFSVIILHVYATDYDKINVYDYNWYVLCLGDSLVKWCVPVLVMISGALFLQPDKNIEIKLLYHKYIFRLLKAYIFWWIIYGIINYFYKCHVLHLSFKIEYVAPWGHLWFLPMLIGLYMILPFLKLIVVKEKYMTYFLLLWFLFLIINFFPYISVITETTKIYFVLGYSGYFVLGYYLLNRNLTKWQAYGIYVLAIFGGAICVLGNILLSHSQGKANTFFLSYLSPHVVFMAIGIFVFFSRVKLSIIITDFCKKIRPYLFGVYLVHYMWLFVLNTPPIRYGINTAFSLPIITISTFVCSLITIKLIMHTPLKRFIE